MANIKELQEAIIDKKQDIERETKALEKATKNEKQTKEILEGIEKLQNKLWKYEEEREQAAQAKKIFEKELEELLEELKEAEKDLREAIGGRASVKVVRDF